MNQPTHPISLSVLSCLLELSLVVWLCGCVVVWLCGCVQVSKCASVQVCKCASVQVCKCASVQVCMVLVLSVFDARAALSVHISVCPEEDQNTANSGQQPEKTRTTWNVAKKTLEHGHAWNLWETLFGVPERSQCSTSNTCCETLHMGMETCLRLSSSSLAARVTFSFGTSLQRGCKSAFVHMVRPAHESARKTGSGWVSRKATPTSHTVRPGILFHTTVLPRECHGVSNNNQAAPGTRESHVDAAPIREEPNAALGASNSGHHNALLLTTLETVDGRHLDARVRAPA